MKGENKMKLKNENFGAINEKYEFIGEMTNFNGNLEENVKISIIIPVYNVEQYIEECIDSLRKQTLRQIEIICVDDCSEDKSLTIIMQYVEIDERIKVVSLRENKSASIARKIGVLLAKGKYIMFVDADDTLESDACNFLLNKIDNKDVDILHFGSNIINCDNLPEARIKKNEKFVQPYFGELKEKDVFEGCFKYQKYQFTLWNKIYNAKIVKQAMDYVEDIILPKAQDEYAFFIISYFAKSYLGIPEVFYNYKFGHGITGHNKLDIDQFKRYCQMGETADAIQRFLIKVGEFDTYSELYEKTRKQLLNDCIGNWQKLETDNMSEGFDLMLQFFEKTEVISAVARTYWWNSGDAVDQILNSHNLLLPQKKIKTIGTYYHKLECGGVQLVLVKLAEYWVELGYKVVVITDCEPSDGDYDLPEGVKRVVIPSFFQITKDNYINRSHQIKKIINEFKIDIFVYHAWLSNILLWDLLSVKLSGCKFVIHCHNIFSMPMLNMRVFFSWLPKVYGLADGVITLSNTDFNYWSNFNSRVFKVTNPTRFKSCDLIEKSKLTNYNIIWCARLSDEKRPFDAIEIFKQVHDVIPMAKLFVLGKGVNEKFITKMQLMVNEYKLNDAVHFFGYQKDVLPFYELSSVCLITSEYEGFSLSLFEGMASGLPTVMYELPYLSLVEEGQGIVSVKYKSIIDAANAVIDLLLNQEKLQSLGEKASKYAETIIKYDYKKTWKEIFEKIAFTEVSIHKMDKMWETLFDHYREGIIRINKKISEQNDKIKNLEMNINRVEKYKNEKKIIINEKETLSLDECIQKLKWNREQRSKLESINKNLENRINLIEKEINNKSIQIDTDEVITVDECVKELKQIREELNKQKEVVHTLEQNNKDLETKLKAADYQITEINKSFSHKLGLFMTYIPRKLRSLIKQKSN